MGISKSIHSQEDKIKFSCKSQIRYCPWMNKLFSSIPKHGLILVYIYSTVYFMTGKIVKYGSLVSTLRSQLVCKWLSCIQPYIMSSYRIQSKIIHASLLTMTGTYQRPASIYIQRSVVKVLKRVVIYTTFELPASIKQAVVKAPTWSFSLI